MDKVTGTTQDTHSIPADAKTADSRVIRNPYAQRRAPQPLFQNPLHTNDNATNDPCDIGAAREGEGDQSAGAPVVHAADSLVAEAPVFATEISRTATIAACPAIHMPKRKDAPPWERLPSRGLSFSSAEIVTVSELCEWQRKIEPHTPSGSDPPVRDWTRRSVRVMGVLTHKLVHNDGSVSLILKDPLPTQQHVDENFMARAKHAAAWSSMLRPCGTDTRATATVEKTGNAGTILRQTPRDSVLIPQPPTSPAATRGASVTTASRSPRQAANPSSRMLRQQSATGLGGTSTPGVRSIIRPQPLRSRSAQPLSTAATSTATDHISNGKEPLSGHKRSWSGIPPKSIPWDPLQRLATVIAGREQNSGVWIVVPPRYESVNQQVVGNLVTVIGEVYWTSFANSTDEGAADPVSGAVRQIVPYLMSMRASEQQVNGEPNERMTTNVNGTEACASPFEATTPPSSLVVDRVMHIQARILQESSGINVALFVQALSARRQLLEKRPRTSSDSCDR